MHRWGQPLQFATMEESKTSFTQCNLIILAFCLRGARTDQSHRP